MHRTALLPMMRFTSLTCPSRLSNAATQQQRPRGTVLSRLCARIPPSRCTRRSSQGLRTNSGVSSCSEVLLSGVAETSSVRNNLMPIGLFACISSAGSGAVRTPGVTTSAGARALVRSADIAFPFSLSGISQQIQHSSTSRYSSFSLRRPHSTSSSCRLSLDTITRCCHSSPRALYSNRPDSSSCFSSLECPWIPVSCPIEVGVSSSISPLALSSPHSASFPDTRSFSYSVRNRRTQSSCLLALVKASSLRSHRRPSLLGPALSSFFPFRVSYRTAFSTTRQAKMDHAAATLNPSGARLPQASGSANSNRGMAGGSCNTIREESMERDHQHHHHHSSASKRVPCYTSYDGVNELMQHSSSNKSDSTQYPVVLDGTGDDMITSSTAGSPSLLNDHLSGDASSFLSHKNDPLHVKGVLGSRPVGKLGDSTLFGIGDSVSSLEYKSMSQKYAEQYEEVKQILLQRGDLSKRVVTANADAYYNHLGLNEYYFQTASPQTVANNLACVIAAKILNEMSHTDFFPQIQQERDGEVFLLAKASLRNRKASQNYKVEREIEAKFLNFEGKGLPYRMQCYRSTGSFFDDPADENERLRTYFLQQPEYAVPVEDVDPCETNLSKVLDVYFYNNKQNTATAEIYRRLNEEVVKDSTGQALYVNVVPRGTGYRMDLAFRRGPHTKEFFSRVGDSVTMWGFYSQRKYVEPLANGVSIITTFIEELPEDQLADTPQISIGRRVERLVKALRMQYIMPPSKFTELAQERLLTIHEAAYAQCATKFLIHFSGTVGPAFGAIEKMVNSFGSASHLSQQELYELRTRLRTPPFSEDSIVKTVMAHTDIVKRLYEEFQEMHHPRAYEERGCVLKEWVEETSLKRDIQRLDSPDAPPILLKFRLFNQHIVRTNFWKDVKQALSFRMNPSFLPRADYPETPYAILFTVGANFTGFHARFAEVARGGIRVVQSFTTQSYQRNKETAFDEVYKLASTQNLKNKDIPEGGSKGVILLNKTETREEASILTPSAFKGYIDSMLDVLLPDERIVDRLSGKEEVLFLGPDEHTGTGGLMDWAAQRAHERNAWFWKAFTTGKSPQMGGVPHDTYGMTTASIETYVRGVLEKEGLKEEEVTRHLVGGPDGDLGSNAILKSQTKTTTIVDGSGVLHDPKGLDLDELRRLANRRFEKLPTCAMDYNAKLLSPQGFKISQDDRDVKLSDGTVIASGFLFRNEFHLNPLGSADLFNPCGGRPASITPFNVDRLFDEKGTPRFKYIVEGANVFITDEARRILEERGVILFKDASTNKGGVTSSSHEVLAALAMSDEEFAEHMQVQPGKNPPAFYQVYVQQVMERIRENARLEFNALWDESIRTGKPRCDLTDVLSAKILRLKRDIRESDSLWQDNELVTRVLTLALPHVLMPGLVSIQTLRKRVPESYLQAIFQSYLASRFYYSQRFTDEDLSMFAFFDYVRHLKGSSTSSLSSAP